MLRLEMHSNVQNDKRLPNHHSGRLYYGPQYEYWGIGPYLERHEKQQPNYMLPSKGNQTIGCRKRNTSGRHQHNPLWRLSCERPLSVYFKQWTWVSVLEMIKKLSRFLTFFEGTLERTKRLFFLLLVYWWCPKSFQAFICCQT